MFGSPVRKIDFAYMFSSTSRGIRIDSGGAEIRIDSSMFGYCRLELILLEARVWSF
jgi:hypothetical protein